MSYNQDLIPLSAEETEFFQQFYEEYKGFIFYIANRYTTIQPDCEDIVQDSVIRLLCNTKSLMALNHPQKTKYIALTVKSAFLDHERKMLASKEIDLDDERLATLLEKSSLCTNADHSQSQMDLWQLRQMLSQRDWLVLEGKYILGYSQDELSELIGVSSDSIRMILHRARSHACDILLKDFDKGGEENG